MVYSVLLIFDVSFVSQAQNNTVATFAPQPTFSAPTLHWQYQEDIDRVKISEKKRALDQAGVLRYGTLKTTSSSAEVRLEIRAGAAPAYISINYSPLPRPADAAHVPMKIQGLYGLKHLYALWTEVKPSRLNIEETPGFGLRRLCLALCAVFIKLRAPDSCPTCPYGIDGAEVGHVCIIGLLDSIIMPNFASNSTYTSEMYYCDRQTDKEERTDIKMLKVVLLVIALTACAVAGPAADTKPLEKGVAPPSDLKADATFWWGYRPISYRAYYARPRAYGYYTPYHNSYWRSGWAGYNYYW
ncbi:hypothetical protein EVAR_18444_1 [Eumeta japonica]|uniref:Uncharacterized protein n=1 Tax=Eumeta variegata TaxID=151549 RepID=A0A4C1V0V5_EUMVA|nr:hypothetical protein EVAR_18444_1 [Eumeta japonica]